MKNKELALLLAIGVLSSTTQADPAYYFGAKPGVMHSRANELDSAASIGIVLGHRFSDRFALETEFTQTAPDGEARISSGEALDRGRWESATLGVYAVGRWGRKLYTKGRMGLLYEDIEVTDMSGISNRNSDVGMSIGIGGGYQLAKNYNLEVESTLVDQDLSIVSIGMNARF